MNGIRQQAMVWMPALVCSVVLLTVVSGGVSLSVSVTGSHGASAQSSTAISGMLTHHGAGGPSKPAPQSAASSVITTITVGSEPQGVAFDYANGHAYVTNSGGTNVTVVDSATNIAIDSITIGSDAHPAITFDPSNGYLYVPNYSGTNLTLIDAATDTVSGSINVGDWPHEAILDTLNGYLYVVNFASNNVTVINGATNTVVTSISSPDFNQPSSATFDSDNGCIYVANDGADSVVVINGSTNKVVGSIADAGESYAGAAFDGTNGYVYVSATSGFVTVINGSTNKVVSELNLGGNVYGIAFDSTNDYIYAINNQFSNVSVIDSSTETGVASVTVGKGPFGAAFDSVNGEVYVTDSGTDTVTVLNGTFRYPGITSFVATPSTIVVGSSTNLDVTTSGGVGTLTYAYQDLPPGCASSSTATLLCTPTKVGSYSVRVFVNDSIGNSVNATTPLTVDLFPITSFAANPASIVVGSTTSLDVSASGGYGTLSYDYSGLPPGCTTSNTASLSCTPTKVGSYTIRVFVNDSGGNSVNATTPLTVDLFPITSFIATPSTIDVGTTTTLAVSATGGSGALSYDYTGLPSGCTSSDTSTLSCTPNASGGFAVRVFVNDTGGNSANTTAALTVNAVPSVSLSAAPSPTDALAPVTFSATVSGGTGPFQYKWLFGDGANATGEVASHAFSSAGNYTVRVYANDTFGLSATNTYLVTVYPKLSATLAVSNSTPLLGQTVAFVANATGGLGPYTYAYSGFPPGCVTEDKPAIGCLPTQADYYNVTVQVTDHNGVTNSSTVTIRVIFDFNVVVPTNTSAGSPFTISVNTNETFSGGTAVVPAAGFGAFTYNYTGLPPGCTSQDAASITCTPTQVGTYHITISVHDQVGDHNTHTVVVNVVPAKSTSGILGLSGETGYLVVGGVVAAAAAAIAAFVVLSRRSKRDRSKGAPGVTDTPGTAGKTESGPTNA